jgi:molybdopterin-guanine dinucleotide biosynthesis protein A
VPSPAVLDVTAIVLCGGESRRFGSDKTRARLGATSVLDHLLDTLPPPWPVVCVGAKRNTTREVTWCREEPPGGGPVAGVSAALPLVDTPFSVLLGGDMPYAGGPAAALADRLRAETDREVVAARDGDGRVQPLLAAYRTDALRAALPSQPAGTALVRLLGGLRQLTVAVDASASLDVDTPADLDAARLRLAP